MTVTLMQMIIIEIEKTKEVTSLFGRCIHIASVLLPEPLLAIEIQCCIASYVGRLDDSLGRVTLAIEICVFPCYMRYPLWCNTMSHSCDVAEGTKVHDTEGLQQDTEINTQM